MGEGGGGGVCMGSGIDVVVATEIWPVVECSRWYTLCAWPDSAAGPARYVASGQQKTSNSQGDTAAGRMVLEGCLGSI